MRKTKKDRLLAVGDVVTITDKGLVRSGNEDHFFFDADRRIFVVADGMGGGQGGAEASDIACAKVDDIVRKNEPLPSQLMQVVEAISNANSAIIDYAKKAGYRQMGTTITSLILGETEEEGGAVVSLGDSRVYRLRKSKLVRLTRDHTIAEEIKLNPELSSSLSSLSIEKSRFSHILTRAIGIDARVSPDWSNIDIKSGDRFLLCSDGVYDMVSDKDLEGILSKDASLADIAKELECKILSAGAIDNYTFILLSVQ